MTLSSSANKSALIAHDHSGLIGPGRILDLECESLFYELPVFSLIESVQAGRAVGNALLHFVEFLQQVHAKDLLSEIPVVQLPAHHDFVEVLQLADGEFSRQQLKPDRGVAQLSPEAVESCLDYSRVIEGQSRRPPYREPRRLSRVGSCGDRVPLGRDQRVVSYRYDPAPRVAAGIAKGIELFEKDVLYTGLFFQFTGGRLL